MNEPAKSEPTQPIRFGVLGTGRITRRMVAELQSIDGVLVTAIASRSGTRAEWFADQYGIAQGVDGYRAVIDDPQIDAVYIATVPSSHHDLTIAAAEAGKMILCEKPLTTDWKSLRSMIQALHRSNVRWLSATGWWHHVRSQAFSDWIDQERFGIPKHLSASVSFFEPFQTDEHRLDPSLGGGCLLDLGWYTFGSGAFLRGSAANRVFADAVFREGTERRAQAMAWFDDGVTATLSCGYDTAARKWFELAGEKASLICDDFTRPWKDRPARCWIHGAAGEVESESFEGNQETRMIRRLIGDEDLTEFQRMAIQTQAMIAAAQTSLRSGKPEQVPRING